MTLVSETAAGEVALAAPPPGLRIVELACRAPSVHNTQPWVWRVDGTTLELYADHGRGLRGADPRGRNLLISCGAALHHAVVAARGLGWQPTVTRATGHRADASEPLARVELTPSPRTADAVADLAALVERRTDRRRFTSWRVQDEQVQWLCRAAARHGVQAVPVTEVVDRFRVEHLTSRARQVQAGDPVIVDEHRRRLDHPTREGLSGARALIDDADADLEPSDGLVVLCTETDEDADWTTVGVALSALWLAAVRRGLSVVPLSQVIEVEETRAMLHADLLGGLTVPQLLVRVGWQPIGRRELARTPRRTLTDTLLP